MPTVELIRVEPVLAHAGHLLSAAFCQRVRRLLLPTPGRGCPPSSEEISAYTALRATARARRVLHAAKLKEYADALAPGKPFRRHPVLLRRVVGFLAAKLGDPDAKMVRHVPAHELSTSVRYLCTAHGCRASAVDILDFLDHVHDEHL